MHYHSVGFASFSVNGGPKITELPRTCVSSLFLCTIYVTLR